LYDLFLRNFTIFAIRLPWITDDCVKNIFNGNKYILFPESIQSEGGACGTQEDLFGFYLVTQSTMTNDMSMF